MNLPGIFSVECASADTVRFSPTTIIDNGITQDVKAYADFTSLCIVGLASCSDECAMELGQNVHQVELEYFTEHLPDFSVPHIFRITDTEGNTYLIGTGNAPHPVVSWTNSVPSSTTGKRGYTVKVKWKSTVGLISLAAE